MGGEKRAQGTFYFLVFPWSDVWAKGGFDVKAGGVAVGPAMVAKRAAPCEAAMECCQLRIGQQLHEGGEGAILMKDVVPSIPTFKSMVTNATGRSPNSSWHACQDNLTGGASQ